jgi:hypothetical protein
MSPEDQNKVEFGDFQTPKKLAFEISKWLVEHGIDPKSVVEPSCGVGAFVLAALDNFSNVESIKAFEINEGYLEKLIESLVKNPLKAKISMQVADFFQTDWEEQIAELPEPLLVIGNFPWVTNSTLGSLKSANLPEKSNFQAKSGLDSITGKANFDISEWMTLEVFKWFENRSGHVAMLCKTAVARKLLASAEKNVLNISESFLIEIDAKKEFGASVDACLLVVGFNLPGKTRNHDYEVYSSLGGSLTKKVGHRKGLTIGNLIDFEKSEYLLGDSPQKWRSGIKHDASAVMEFTRTDGKLINGLGVEVDIEDDFLYPLLKGSDVATGKLRDPKFVLVTQKKVGEETDSIETKAPKTWNYLNSNSEKLDGRGSIIYKKNPRFSVFGVGDYSFKPFKIAICGLYKNLSFKLVEPINDRAVMFDDTVYFVSFDTREEALSVLKILDSEIAKQFLGSLIFWDEKRPVKTAVLNLMDWSKFEANLESVF